MNNKIITAHYRANLKAGGTVKIDAEIPIEISQMIVWALMHPADAMYLLPEYQKLRDAATEREERQSTHCGQDF